MKPTLFAALFIILSLPSAWSDHLSCFEILQRLAQPRLLTQETQGNLTRAPSLLKLEEAYGNRSFFSIQQRLEPRAIREANEHLRQLLLKNTRPKKVEGTVNHITQDQAKKLKRALTENNVYRNETCYDRTDVTIGFCFARATVVHMESLLRGVNPNSIKKIWIVGDMDHWGHHVATMVKAKEGGWWVIDNITDVVKAEVWMQRVSMLDRNQQNPAMFFVSQASRFGPENARSYSAIDLFNAPPGSYNRGQDYYNGYFYDYFEWLDARGSVNRFRAP